jgi:hypothetical protein
MIILIMEEEEDTHTMRNTHMKSIVKSGDGQVTILMSILGLDIETQSMATATTGMKEATSTVM